MIQELKRTIELVNKHFKGNEVCLVEVQDRGYGEVLYLRYAVPFTGREYERRLRRFMVDRGYPKDYPDMDKIAVELCPGP